jgi:protoheme IX farnesyltransferase
MKSMFRLSTQYIRKCESFPISNIRLSHLQLQTHCFSTTPSSSAPPVPPTTNKKVISPLKTKLKAMSDLMKLRLSSLVVVTTGAGYLYAGGPVDIATMAYACVGTGMCAASACTFNEIFEVKQDAAMNRTKTRPIPSGKITKAQATMIGMSTALGGTTLLYAMTNPTVALLGLGNIVLYAGAYTYSKRVTEFNTWIGSVVGAIPPVMGWCAATGGDLSSVEPYIIGSLLFLWQFPHFFALSWLHREDYARGNFQMVPVNDPTGIRTANLIQEYSLYLTVLPILTTGFGYTSSMYILEGTAVNMYLLYLSSKFSKDRTNANARRIFLTSLWYLPALLAGLVLYSKNWDKDAIENKQHQLQEQKDLEMIENGLLTTAPQDQKPENDKVLVNFLFFLFSALS